MKKAYLLFLFCSLSAFGAYDALPAAPAPAGVALRYVTAAHALSLVKQHLGADAAGAVSSVDEKRNLIALDTAHAQAPIIRAFLTGLDNPPAEVRVEATIARKLAATATAPARDEVVSRRTFLTQAGQPEVLTIPGDPNSTEVELRFIHIGK